MFSGGVGHYYYHPVEIRTLTDVTVHDDVGPLLAESLRNNAALSAYRVITPAETLRATVRLSTLEPLLAQLQPASAGGKGAKRISSEETPAP